ncbi:MAG: hypothetical protein H0X37_07505 [Herpetosiphonaceae bacterium]|nr:hypothetical protein [Herpetosiphonaceae bacterium]
MPTLRRWTLLWESPFWSGLLALVVYGLIAGVSNPGLHASPYSYFGFLADALLHGQLNLRLRPPSTLDLSLFNGKYYLYWPPLPAVLMLPFVAVWGVGFSDVLFTLIIAVANVSLVALLLRQLCRRRVLRLHRIQRGILVLFFALGTVHVTLAPFGKVWPTEQLVGFLWVVLAYLAALNMEQTAAFFWTGCSFACVFLTRNHMLFNGLWPAYYLLYTHRRVPWRSLLGFALVGLAPVVLAIGLLGLYNWQRFDSLISNGVDYHQMGNHFVGDFVRYGAFSLHYVPRNLFYQYVAYPLPIRPASREGGSLFLLSPVFFAALWGIWRCRHSWSMWVLLGSIVLVAIPILLLLSTGWVQWGPRYTLDFTVPLLMLTALGVRCRSTRLLSYMTIISVGHYLVGGLLFSVLSQGFA